MTPKQKAKELVDKYNYFLPDAVEINKEHLKYCAVLVVDEIIDVLSKDINPLVNYWFDVKQEIQEL